ncbi:MAG: hypothetical protein ACOVNY_04580, partial [Chitinophagaceae bacterium]
MTTKNATLLFKILRFGFGMLFIIMGFRGFIQEQQGAFILIFIGIIFFVTRFFAPKRCLQDSSFNADDQQHQWNNYQQTSIITKLQHEIKQFKSLIEMISKYEYLFIFISIDRLLRFHKYSEEFIHYILY